jgi:hypothetical protein
MDEGTHALRQQILAHLIERDELTRAELAELLAVDPDIPTTDTHQLEIVLHHVHLPQLDDAMFVEYDPRTGDISRWEDPRVIKSNLANEENDE